MNAIYSLGERSKKMIISSLVFMLLLAFGVGLPSLVYAQKPTAYMDITVDKAHNIIEHEPFSHIVILDVRNQSEYDLGHLYNAVLIPVYQLENRTRELQAHANDEIIVYCRAGSRSALACQILVENGFTKVYNMLGGIIAWINAGYSIYTTFHYVTVDTTDRTQIQIDPMLLHSCGCSSCSQSASTCPCNKEIGDGEYSILEQNESRIVFLQQFEVNGTTFIVTVDRSLLWSYATHENDINRTAGFFLTVTTDGNMSMRFYTLIYAVQNAEYDLTITTNILLLNSEKYDNSFTIIKYVPAGKPEVESRESVHFNSSVTLSQQYAILGEIARKIGKAYRKSENAALSSLASSYKVIQRESEYLSKLVTNQLPEYDRGS